LGKIVQSDQLLIEEGGNTLYKIQLCKNMMDRKERILAFMREDAYKPLLFSELVTVLDVPKSDIGLFENLLKELEEEGLIFKNRKNRYGVPERMNLVCGYLQEMSMVMDF